MAKKSKKAELLRYFVIKADGEVVDHAFSRKEAKKKAIYHKKYWLYEDVVFTIEEEVMAPDGDDETAYEYDPDWNDFNCEEEGVNGI